MGDNGSLPGWSFQEILGRSREGAVLAAKRAGSIAGAWGKTALDLLSTVRSSQFVVSWTRDIERRVTRSRAGPPLEAFLARLDGAAAWVEPRIRAARLWLASRTREEKAAIAAAALAVLFLGLRLSELPLAGVTPAQRLEVAAYFENGWGGAFPSSFPSLKRQTGPRGRTVDVIYPVWHTVMPDGTVESAMSTEVLAYCRANGIGVVPVVTNMKLPAGDNSGVLKDRRSMARAVDALARQVEEHGYDGLNLSFELVSPAYRRALTALATDLSVAMKDRGRAFLVSVFPDVEMPPEISGAYDYDALGRVSDAVVLMAYDRHWPRSAPGPVAPIEWVDRCVRRTARSIPVSRLILGIGSYGYDWPSVPRAGKAEYIPTPAALQRASAQGTPAAWDAENMEAFYKYEWGGLPRTVRFLDGDAVRLRAGIARKYGLRGVAFWRLGFEDPAAGGQMPLSIAQ
ncbi:MAG: hypothetical protein HPY55_11850 [Firmicutes bacterium]|nr:hypothetical protein [Bacillota bacterium]